MPRNWSRLLCFVFVNWRLSSQAKCFLRKNEKEREREWNWMSFLHLLEDRNRGYKVAILLVIRRVVGSHLYTLCFFEKVYLWYRHSEILSNLLITKGEVFLVAGMDECWEKCKEECEPLDLASGKSLGRVFVTVHIDSSKIQLNIDEEVVLQCK